MGLKELFIERDRFIEIFDSRRNVSGRIQRGCAIQIGDGQTRSDSKRLIEILNCPGVVALPITREPTIAVSIRSEWIDDCDLFARTVAAF